MQREIVSRAWLGRGKDVLAAGETIVYSLESGYKGQIGITLFISRSLETLESA